MSAFPGVLSYQSSSPGSKFVVIGVVCCQEMRRNALFHKVLPVLTKYLYRNLFYFKRAYLSIINNLFLYIFSSRILHTGLPRTRTAAPSSTPSGPSWLSTRWRPWARSCGRTCSGATTPTRILRPTKKTAPFSQRKTGPRECPK